MTRAEFHYRCRFCNQVIVCDGTDVPADQAKDLMYAALGDYTPSNLKYQVNPCAKYIIHECHEEIFSVADLLLYRIVNIEDTTIANKSGSHLQKVKG